MEILWTKTKTLVVLGLAGLVLGGALVKHFWFPTVDDIYFQLDSRRLETAPDGVFIFRETQFGGSQRSGVSMAQRNDRVSSGREPEVRYMARNASLKDIIAMAFQCPPSRVLMPSDAPTNRFDVLLTRSRAAERLQKYIRGKFGYSAGWQECEAPVLALCLKGRTTVLQPSKSGDKHNVLPLSHRLGFKNASVSQIAQFAERAFEQPVQDRTNLKGNYDFEIAWEWDVSGSGLQDAMKKSLDALGLKLEPDTVTMRMMVVDRPGRRAGHP